MQATKVTVSRIMLRDRGGVSELSIDGELIITQDDPTADALIQHVPETVRVSSLPTEQQATIRAVFDMCQARLERKHGVTNV